MKTKLLLLALFDLYSLSSFDSLIGIPKVDDALIMKEMVSQNKPELAYEVMSKSKSLFRCNLSRL